MSAIVVNESSIIEVDGGVIVKVSDDFNVVAVPSENKSILVSNEELTVVDRQLWIQWTQALPPIFQSAVEAIGLSGREYSDILAAQLLSQMQDSDTGIYRSIEINHDAVAQQMMQVVNNHGVLAGIVETKITQADANSAIAIAVEDMAVVLNSGMAQNFVSKTAFTDGLIAKTSEIDTAKSSVLTSVAQTYVEKTTYATDKEAFSQSVTDVSAAVGNAVASVIQSYTVYVDQNLSYDVKVYSTHGSMFKNGVIDTVLTAKIFKGKEDVTATIPVARFTWKRVSADSIGDTQWNSTKVGVGSVLNITDADVYIKAVFSCIVDLN